MSRVRRSLASVGVALLAAAAPASTAAADLPPGFEEVVIARALTMPTAIDWAPDGRMFIAEKAGRVFVSDSDGEPPALLLDISDHVNTSGERGLIGLAVDADFESNRYLYLLYNYETDASDYTGPKVARVTRVAVNPDNSVENPASPETVLLGTDTTAPCPPPSNESDCIAADTNVHTVGTIHSDPEDGTLWISTGEGADWATVDERSFRAYDETSYSGKLLHVDRSGRGLPDHPFCPGETDLTKVCTKVHAKGFRNPFRFTLRSSRPPVVGDVGSGTSEEVDIALPGKNYGWPCYEGSVRTPGFRDHTRCSEEYAKEGTDDEAMGPVYAYASGGCVQDPDVCGAAVVGGPIYSGTSYPSSYRGGLFVGDYVRATLDVLTLDETDRVSEVRRFARLASGMVDLKLAPDGDLVYVDFGSGKSQAGSVRKIRYTADNHTPVARAEVEPAWGSLPLTVAFRGDGSTDADDDRLTYTWAFGDGSPTSAEANPSHTYTEAGKYVARLTVDDGRGGVATDSVVVWPGNTPPDLTVESPTTDTTYRGGDTVALRATATDAEDGSLPEAAVSWHVILHHGSHVHDYGQFAGTAAALPVGDDHDADSHLEITVTATDSQGLSRTRAITLYPRTIALRLESSPPGATLTYGGVDYLAPVARRAAVGFRTAVSALETFEHGGRSYVFVGWSNGEPRLHGIAIPDEDLTLVARYATAPASTAPPAVTGEARDGETLTAATGEWTGTAPITFRHQWRRCDAAGVACVDIAGATETTYRVRPADVGGRLVVRVTATNDAGLSERDSEPTPTVQAAPPANIARPTVRAEAREGEVLDAAPGEWAGTPNISFAYQWRRCDAARATCADVVGATRARYRPVLADVGKRLRVRVVAVNTGGSAWRESKPSRRVRPFVVAIGPSPVTLSVRGVLALDVTCRASTRCRGRIALARAKGATTARPEILGRARFSVRAHRSSVLAIRLSSAGRRLIERRGKLAVVATIKVERRARTAIATRRLVVRASRTTRGVTRTTAGARSAP